MGYWVDDKYHYTKSELQFIARNYKDYLEPQIGGQSYDKSRGMLRYGIDYSKDALRHDMLSSKIDFDRALNKLGYGEWSGTHFGENNRDYNFKTYRSFSKGQRIIIADILGIDDWELEVMGFYDINKYKAFTYILMVKFLNGT